MSTIDEFATSLLDEAKRFLEKSSDTSDAGGKAAYLHAALMLGFCALEAHTNAIADDFLLSRDLTVHEKALLLEREVRLDKGKFVVSETLKIARLEDRIEFLHCRFSGKQLNRSATWWSDLSSAVKLRNELTHPKGAPAISEDAIKRAIQSIVDTLDALFQAVFKTRFPAATRGLQSKLTF